MASSDEYQQRQLFNSVKLARIDGRKTYLIAGNIEKSTFKVNQIRRAVIEEKDGILWYEYTNDFNDKPNKNK